MKKKSEDIKERMKEPIASFGRAGGKSFVTEQDRKSGDHLPLMLMKQEKEKY